YALKAYSDDFGQNVWKHGQALRASLDPHQEPGLSLPIAHRERERLLIFQWVNGVFLSEIVDERKPELLQKAAKIAAELHSSKIIPEPLTTAEMMVEDTRGRYERLRGRWPTA